MQIRNLHSVKFAILAFWTNWESLKPQIIVMHDFQSRRHGNAIIQYELKFDQHSFIQRFFSN